MKVPCRDCPDRKVGCHAVCDRYKAYQAVKEEERRQRLVELKMAEFRFEGKKRSSKQWNRKQRKRYT